MQTTVPENSNDIVTVGEYGRDCETALESLFVSVGSAFISGASVLAGLPTAVPKGELFVPGTGHHDMNGDECNADETAAMVILCPFYCDGFASAPDSGWFLRGVVHATRADVRTGLGAFAAFAGLG